LASCGKIPGRYPVFSGDIADILIIHYPKEKINVKIITKTGTGPGAPHDISDWKRRDSVWHVSHCPETCIMEKALWRS
jgi:hypothetical protein